MGWTDQPTAILALRSMIYDGPVDKFAEKDLIGTKDGVNCSFKTFENRRVTNFTTATAPLGLLKNGALISTANIVSDDFAGTGIVVVTSGVTPGARDTFKGIYYYQWFQDSDLDGFMQNASNWLTVGASYWTGVPDGLNAAFLRFAAQEAYLAAAMKYSLRMSQVYKTEDAPSEDISKSIDSFQKMAQSFMDNARDLRNDYYKRAGQSLSPAFGLGFGRVRDPQPRR